MNDDGDAGNGNSALGIVAERFAIDLDGTAGILNVGAGLGEADAGTETSVAALAVFVTLADFKETLDLVVGEAQANVHDLDFDEVFAFARGGCGLETPDDDLDFLILVGILLGVVDQIGKGD